MGGRLEEVLHMMERETREKYGVRDKKGEGGRGRGKDSRGGDFARGGRKKYMVFYCLILKDDEFTSCFIPEFS